MTGAGKIAELYARIESSASESNYGRERGSIPIHAFAIN
jgi:hypothetical protein